MKPDINLNKVLEGALSYFLGYIAFGVVCGVGGYLYAVISGKTQPNSWLRIGVGAFVVIALVAWLWKRLAVLFSTVGRWIIQNWQLVVGLVLIVAVALYAFALTKMVAVLAFVVVQATGTVLLSRYARREASQRAPIIYADDFSGLGNWDCQGNWSIVKEGGTNVLVVTGSERGGYVPDCQSWEDYILDFETKIVVDWSAWLIRAKNNNTYVMLQCGTKFVRIHYRVNGAWTQPEAIGLPLTLQTNKWFGVHLAAR